MRNLVAALALGTLVAFVTGCAGAGPPSAEPVRPSPVSPSPVSPSPLPPEEARQTPLPSGAAAARELPPPVAESNPERQPDGSFLVAAVSSPSIEVAIPYQLVIVTHCGITPTTFDVGGTFWDPVGETAGLGLPDPEDAGVFVLVAPNEAIWTSSTGRQIQLVRGAAEPRQVFLCD
jgi:hypothetical protein